MQIVKNNVLHVSCSSSRLVDLNLDGVLVNIRLTKHKTRCPTNVRSIWFPSIYFLCLYSEVPFVFSCNQPLASSQISQISFTKHQENSPSAIFCLQVRATTDSRNLGFQSFLTHLINHITHSKKHQRGRMNSILQICMNHHR